MCYTRLYISQVTIEKGEVETFKNGFGLCRRPKFFDNLFSKVVI